MSLAQMAAYSRKVNLYNEIILKDFVIPANSLVTNKVLLEGCENGDFVNVSYSVTLNDNVILTAQITSKDTVVAVFRNLSKKEVKVGVGTLHVLITKKQEV